jgi:type III secretion protein U
MSGGNASEERALPASQRKLREARRKGQVSHSQDFVNAAVVLVAAIYLWTQWGTIAQRLERMLSLPATVEKRGFSEMALQISVELASDAAAILVPVAGLVTIGVIISNILMKKGIVASTEPIVPRMDRLNPVTGLQQLFSLRSIVNLLKSLLKLLLLLVGLFVIILLGLDGVLGAPGCGVACVVGVGGNLLKQLMAVAVGLFIVFGLADIGLQHWLFLRDMRMTRSEMKRELKDTEGDPLIRRQRRRRRQEVFAGSTRLGAEQATFFIAAPGSPAVGLRYVRGETPVPVVVAKGSGAEAERMLALAREKGLPVETNPALVARVVPRLQVGVVVPEALYDTMAEIIVRNKVI